MKFIKNPVESSFFRKITLVLSALFVLQFVLGLFLIYQVSQKEARNQIQNIAERVKEDISFKNGKWDTHRYNADPDLPGTYPLYIFGSDGYVIDRWKPIHGFLDTSDAKKLLSYQSAQTVSTDTSQSWRVLSKPVAQNGEQFGVVTVAYFNPQQDRLSDIDTQLQNNASFILSKVKVTNGTISTENLDVRDISYDVVFQIVDQYNKIITKTDNTNSIDRIPNFIDTSYIGDVLHGPTTQILRDTLTNEPFIITTKPIVNSQNYVIGTIVVGKSIAFVGNIIRDYLITEGILGFILSALALLIIFQAARRFAKEYNSAGKKEIVNHIAFDKKSGILSLEKETIELPYATNQYYLVETLFSAPKKRWETDKLLEKFGEVDSYNWRKVYDAMTIVNKKVSEFMDDKLIIVKDKTYQLNPQLIDKLH